MRSQFRLPTSARTLARRAALRVATLALLWWALIGDNPAAWWFGAPVVLVATLVGLALAPDEGSGGRWRWTFSGIVRFVPFFLWQSLRGGVDVTVRAIRPRMPLTPDVVDYEMRLPQGPARLFMAMVVCLPPGTLTAELEGGRLRVHTLTRGPRILESLREMESRVAGLFGLELEPEPDEGPGAKP